jgi:hypothetical protein
MFFVDYDVFEMVKPSFEGVFGFFDHCLKDKKKKKKKKKVVH